MSGQRLVYKFVDLPYNYKPIKNLYDSGILEMDRVDKRKDTYRADHTTREAFQVISRHNYITTVNSAVSEGKVQQEPIRSQHVTHVHPIRNGCCCGGVSRGMGHISVPVIMKCGQPSALPRHNRSADGQALA